MTGQPAHTRIDCTSSPDCFCGIERITLIDLNKRFTTARRHIRPQPNTPAYRRNTSYTIPQTSLIKLVEHEKHQHSIYISSKRDHKRLDPGPYW